MITGELATRAQELRDHRVPFVTATVVRAAKPTSVRPGDSALVGADGTIEGFVGGHCAQSSVRLYAARALETGEPLLLRLLPDAGPDSDAGEGVFVAHNPCLSGGAMEIFLEPHLAAPRIVVAGDTPIARALAQVARAAGYDVADGGEVAADDAALVVASHGSDEEGALAAALEAGVPYVALVASRRRGVAVVESLDVAPELRAQIRTPAGLDIGARAPGDIAVAILAELIGERRAHAPAPAPTLSAIDPVCGMEVAITDATVHLGDGDERVYFCCEGCRSAYAAAH
ncbi:MAG TPA: XdhC family protein [Solirubrobacteraceae bacterium]